MSKEIYVAINGKDTHPGTKARPFATLTRARDALRALPVAERAGILDLSAFSKYEVGGKDAEAFLNRIFANRCPERDGGVVLAQNIGAVVPVLERLFGFNLFPADIYYITELPSDLRTADVVKFALMALGMSLLSTLYPAWRASRTHPAEALRYE